MQQLKPNTTHHLEQSGLRSTKARIGILSILGEEQKPIDVMSLRKKLKAKKIDADEATVYRILDMFTKKRIVHRIELGEGKFRYELPREHHHHLICEHCGRIEDIEECKLTSIEKKIAKDKKFTIHHHALEFFGLCAKCH